MNMITIQPDSFGQPLHQAAHITLPCGGRKHCGNCGVYVRGNVSQITPEEAALLRKTAPAFPCPEEGFTWRLACFCRLEGEVSLYLPEEAPVVASALGRLPAYDGKAHDSYGLAVDIGTTTITMTAYRFPGEAPVSGISETNRQSAYGSDVASRIAGDPALLHQCITAQLGSMLAQTGIAPAHISRVVLTGNTVMLHLMKGLDPSGMGVFPFKAQSLFGETTTFDLFPHAEVYLPPCISAYLGADLVCAALAAEVANNHNTLLVDVGTNGEMMLHTGDALYCCSVAAGPAFEGAEISQGMAALPGAVDRVWAEEGQLLWRCIEGAAPRGICGTGMLSALRAFLALGCLDETGAIQEGAHTIQQDGAAALWLGDACGIAITQRDVRNLQLAKAAIAGGIDTLLQEAKRLPGSVATLWLAGGFGSYINPEDAAAIGMIPSALAPATVAGGNLALQGAAILLFSRKSRAEALRIAAASTEIALATHPVFQEKFIDSIDFPIFVRETKW